MDTNSLEKENSELKKRCAWLERQLDLRYQQLDSLNKQARTLAEWLTRSNTCPYPDDYDCPRLHHGMCFASDEIMRGCWLDASARGLEKFHVKEEN